MGRVWRLGLEVASSRIQTLKTGYRFHDGRLTPVPGTPVMPAPNVTPKANGSSGRWMAIFTVLSRGEGDGAPRRSHGCDLIDPPRPAVPFAGAGSFRTALSPSGPPARSLDGGPWASNPCARGAPQQIKNDLLRGDFLRADS